MQPDQTHRRSGEGRIRRRATDRLGDAVGWLLSTLALFAVVAAVVVAAQVHGNVLARAEHEAATRTQVQAVVVTDAQALPSPGGGPLPSLSVAARWIAPDGIERTGPVTVRGAVDVGASVPVWVDRTGMAVPAPTEPGLALAAGIFAGIGLTGGAAFLLWLAWLGVQRWIFACNAAGWEREWAAVEPRWSGRIR
ncbi:Rv1733c family protein [Pseudonocardia asaccharolytica]|uniref:Integral membrane protein n=1 Tax=Pseudonocardia asaccharolytica DSM 44247 = NBRC 16224 TaxID=1123024 RepID=A0A511D6W0_9PSEU|nr:hypothetical protein [Pseudonocardia asaccharolytica]GEL20377.1 hypothetical protein PA7_42140 [Pseudonocardia asaccharolytica DSM 44247 = NBRC 16224]